MRKKLGIAGSLLALAACKTEMNTPDPPATAPPAQAAPAAATPPATVPTTAAAPVPATAPAPATAPIPTAAPVPGTAAAPASPGGALAGADGELIQADCKLNGDNLRGNEGKIFRVSCPAGCEKDGHHAYGTGVYTSDSPVCKAGVHAGAIAGAGGVVTVRIDPGRPAYRGKDQHGVKSRDYAKYRRSFAVITPENASRPAADASLIEAGCSYGAGQLDGPDGTTFRVACPAGCDEVGHNVYGTGVYTTDSPICKAAIHTGAIPPKGGIVSVRIEPGRSEYSGSQQNGISSRRYGKYKKSYAVVVP
jgi:hypothetical protein